MPHKADHHTRHTSTQVTSSHKLDIGQDFSPPGCMFVISVQPVMTPFSITYVVRHALLVKITTN